MNKLTDEQIKHIRERAELNSNRQVDLVKFARDIESAILAQPIDAKPKESVDSESTSVLDAVNAFENYVELKYGGIETNSWHDAPVDSVFIDGFNLGRQITTKPQRITEQDAYEIIEAAFEIKGNKNVLFMADFFENGGRKLLAKLNEHREPEEADDEGCGCSSCEEGFPCNFSRLPVTANKAEVPKLDKVEGDVLPPIGESVFIHLASSNEWVKHKVVGYYVWKDLKCQDHLHRVFVRVVDNDGILNARLLSDVKWLPLPPLKDGAQ